MGMDYEMAKFMRQSHPASAIPRSCALTNSVGHKDTRKTRVPFCLTKERLVLHHKFKPRDNARQPFFKNAYELRDPLVFNVQSAPPVECERMNFKLRPWRNNDVLFHNALR